MILHGRYELWLSGKPLGEERFHLEQAAMESDTEVSRPVPSRQHLRLELDERRAITEVILEIEVDSRKTRGRYRFDRAASSLRSWVQPPEGASIERLLPCAADVHLSALSPLFQFVTVGRLRLRPGERRDVELICIRPGSLMPEPQRVRYVRLPDVEYAAPRGTLSACDYRIERLDEPAPEQRFQANLLGLPLHTLIPVGDVTIEQRLVE